jgi:hypothetical protein
VGGDDHQRVADESGTDGEEDGRWSNYQDRATYSAHRGARLVSELGLLAAFASRSRSWVRYRLSTGPSPATHHVGGASGFALAPVAFGCQVGIHLCFTGLGNRA